MNYKSYMLFKKCPRCKGEHLELSITAQRLIEVKANKKVSEYLRETDAGYTKCLDCGYDEKI